MNTKPSKNRQARNWQQGDTPWGGSVPGLMLTDNERYQLLRVLEQNPNLSQRQLANEVGYSLGKLNYCLRALKDKGWVKVENFRNNQNKSAYFYKLTPAGFTEKARVTRRFLHKKLEEHEKIRRDIAQLQLEVAQQGTCGED